MSDARVELFRGLVERWNSGERDFAIPAYVDSAIELETPFSSLAGAPYRGYAGIERWVRDVDEQFAEWSIGLDDVRPAGNQVVALATVVARGRASDAGLHFPVAAICTFGADDRIIRLRICLDITEARATGLQS